MRILALCCYMAALLVMPLLLPVVAFAQETTINAGDLIAPWLEMLVGAAAVLITAILGWVAAMIKSKTGIDVDLARMQTLQTALTNGAGILISRVGKAADNVVFDVKHPAIRDAVLYVSQAAPEAVRHFGLTPEQLAEKLVAKVGLATAPNTIPPAVST